MKHVSNTCGVIIISGCTLTPRDTWPRDIPPWLAGNASHVHRHPGFLWISRDSCGLMLGGVFHWSLRSSGAGASGSATQSQLNSGWFFLNRVKTVVIIQPFRFLWWWNWMKSHLQQSSFFQKSEIQSPFRLSFINSICESSPKDGIGFSNP